MKLSLYFAIFRNLTINLANDYGLWSTGSSSDQFTVSAKLNYPEQSLAYSPGVWQLLKWGWVQYLSILLVFMYAAAGVRSFVFSNQILPTLVSFDQKH